MMDAAPLDDLLGHARFARSLARALVRGEHLAEDAVSVSTVNSRLQRALAQLRERLDARRDGHGAWVGALVVFARPGVPAARAVVGGAVMGAKTNAAIACAVLLLGGLATWRWTS